MQTWILKQRTVAIAWLILCIPPSCRQPAAQEAEPNGAASKKGGKYAELLVGSWVERNPIHEKEFQGMTLRDDGTAESINMATLLYKKWWIEQDSLVLVYQSIGNKVTFVDTTKYEIIRLNTKELEIRFKEYSFTYQKQ